MVVIVQTLFGNDVSSACKGQEIIIVIISYNMFAIYAFIVFLRKFEYSK